METAETVNTLNQGESPKTIGEKCGSKPKRQKPSVKSKGKRQESTQGAKSPLVFRSKFKLIRSSPTGHGFPGKHSPLFLDIRGPLKEPAGVRWLQRLRLGRRPRISK